MRKIILMTSVFASVFALSVLVAGGTIGLGVQKVGAVDVLKSVCDNPNATEAPEVCKGTRDGEQDSPEKNPLFGPQGILTRAVEMLSLLAGIISIIVIILGGFKYIVSSGDSNAVATAQRTVIYGVIGLAVVAIAQVVVIFALRTIR